MLDTEGIRNKRPQEKTLQLEYLEIFFRLEVFGSLGVNDGGNSQLQQQEEVIYTERNTVKQMDVWAESPLGIWLSASSCNAKNSN